MSVRSSEEKDFLLRIIKQIAESIARMREILTATTDGSQRMTVRAEAQIAATQLLGADAALLASLDAVTAVALVRDVERVSLWADLLEVEAEACFAMGSKEEGERLMWRAGELRKAVSGGTE